VRGAALSGAASGALLEVRWRPTSSRLVRRSTFRLIGTRNIQKGSSSRSFAYSPKLGTRSSIVSKARRTATSGSFGKTNSPDHEKIEMPTIVLKITHAPDGRSAGSPGRMSCTAPTRSDFHSSPPRPLSLAAMCKFTEREPQDRLRRETRGKPALSPQNAWSQSQQPRPLVALMEGVAGNTADDEVEAAQHLVGIIERAIGGRMSDSMP
jgi:hypothetical protein